MAPPTISIHALLAESDRVQGGQFPGFCISIHALLAESDGSPCMIWSNIFLFLSTLSLRRATTGTTSAKMPRWDFYPRSPCGERLQCHPPQPRPPFISIHALLAESDLAVADLGKGNVRFLSTLSLRRATFPVSVYETKLNNFYPRSPCGERLHSCRSYCIDKSDFYPRSPCGERLLIVRQSQIISEISIHALLAESDLLRHVQKRLIYLFLSTLSLRRATTVNIQRPAAKNDFYPRSPCGERPYGTRTASKYTNFYPRSPCGERRGCVAGNWPRGIFLSTLSLRRATALIWIL